MQTDFCEFTSDLEKLNLKKTWISNWIGNFPRSIFER